MSANEKKPLPVKWNINNEQRQYIRDLREAAERYIQIRRALDLNNAAVEPVYWKVLSAIEKTRSI